MSKPGNKVVFETFIVDKAGLVVCEPYYDSTTQSVAKTLPKFLERLDELGDEFSITINLLSIPREQWKHGYEKVKVKDVLV